MFSSIQPILGLIFTRSDVKANIRPGVKARPESCVRIFTTQTHIISLTQVTTTHWVHKHSITKTMGNFECGSSYVCVINKIQW